MFKGHSRLRVDQHGKWTRRPSARDVSMLPLSPAGFTGLVETIVLSTQYINLKDHVSSQTITTIAAGRAVGRVEPTSNHPTGKSSERKIIFAQSGKHVSTSIYKAILH